jgi:endonuclease/exonuclease/phosphatase family metal-dependent hydrolase
VLIRTWNLFHGNTVPLARRAYLREMVELVTADRPDLVCLQEVPAWALGRLGGWAGMTAVPVLARRASVGPVPIPAGLGRALTAPHHGIVRSAFAGQGNAILVSTRMAVTSSATRPIDDRAQGREPRVAQRVEFESHDGRRLVVANVHCTNSPDPAVCDAELGIVLSWTSDADMLVLAGDFNVTPERSEVLPSLGPAFSSPVPGSIDQILARGVEVPSIRVWPADERRLGSTLLSDHPVVEAVVEEAPR